MKTPGLATARALAMASWLEVRAGPEHVAVPVLPGDAVGHRRLDDQHLLELGGHRQHRDGRCAGRRAHHQVHLVVGVELGDLLLRHVGLELVVLLEDLDLAPQQLLLPRGRVLEAQVEAAPHLLGVDLVDLRPCEALHQADLDTR
jgi:hypothetical protein